MDVLEIIDTMTGLEVAAAEDAAGQSIASIADDEVPKMKLYAGIVWQLRRRDEPNLKFTEVLGQTSRQIMADLGRFEEAEPDESFPVDDDTSGAGRGEGEDEGQVLSGDGDPAE